MRNNDYKEDHTLSQTLDSYSILRTFDQFPHARDDDGFIKSQTITKLVQISSKLPD